MKNDVENQQVACPCDEKIVVRAQNAPYSSPVLRVYGSVGKLTQGGASLGADMANRQAASDPSIKENICRVGDHPLGIGVYLFDYKPEYREQYGHGRQFGVMADEIEIVMPEAVSVHPDGYKMVHYGMLGIHRSDQ